MKTATITKTLKKLEAITEDYSLGFKRFNVLPIRVVKAVNLNLYLKNKHTDNHNEIKAFFESMTNEEYVNFLKLA